MGVSRGEAAWIALALANREWGFPRGGEELVILHQWTEESEAAWAFVYNTRSFVESGDMMQSLVGNGPVVVCKATGEATLMPSAYSSQEALRAWQSQQARRS
jgi:Immunity protein 35